VRGAPEVEIRKRLAEVLHEGLDVCMTATRRVQRVLQQHVGSSELVDDGGVVLLTPEMREPAADDGLVVVLSRHVDLLELRWAAPVKRTEEPRDVPNLALEFFGRDALGGATRGALIEEQRRLATQCR